MDDTRISEEKPSEVVDVQSIAAAGPPPYLFQRVLGKWMVFEPISRIDDTWYQIAEAVISGELGAISAKVSTAKENPTATSNRDKVICVYTSEQTMDEVGLKLIDLPRVRKTIRYKTDQATLEGRYANRGDRKICSRTLNWNNGTAAFQ